MSSSRWLTIHLPNAMATSRWQSESGPHVLGKLRTPRMLHAWLTHPIAEYPMPMLSHSDRQCLAPLEPHYCLDIPKDQHHLRSHDAPRDGQEASVWTGTGISIPNATWGAPTSPAHTQGLR